MIILEKTYNDIYPNKTPKLFSTIHSKIAFDNPFKCEGFQYVIDNAISVWNNKLLPIIADGKEPKRSSKITDLTIEEDIYLSTHLNHPATEKDKVYDNGLICGHFRIFVIEDIDIDFEIIEQQRGIPTKYVLFLDDPSATGQSSGLNTVTSIFIGNGFDESNECIIKFIYRLAELLFAQKFRSVIPFNNYPDEHIVISPNLADISTIRFIAEYHITIFRAINSILLDDNKISFEDIIKSKPEHYIFDKDIMKALYEYSSSVNRNGSGSYKEIMNILKKMYTTITCD